MVWYSCMVLFWSKNNSFMKKIILWTSDELCQSECDPCRNYKFYITGNWSRWSTMNSVSQSSWETYWVFLRGPMTVICLKTGCMTWGTVDEMSLAVTLIWSAWTVIAFRLRLCYHQSNKTYTKFFQAIPLINECVTNKPQRTSAERLTHSMLQCSC